MALAFLKSPISLSELIGLDPSSVRYPFLSTVDVPETVPLFLSRLKEIRVCRAVPTSFRLLIGVYPATESTLIEFTAGPCLPLSITLSGTGINLSSFVFFILWSTTSGIFAHSSYVTLDKDLFRSANYWYVVNFSFSNFTNSSFICFSRRDFLRSSIFFSQKS
jgi:hypothetical protein